jgi:hypothetical protein
VNSAYVVRIVQDDDGMATLHLTTGNSVTAMLMFEIIDGQLKIDPTEDDEVPFG